MDMLVGQKAPQFTTMAAVNGEFQEISLKDFEGKHVVLFFYPLDFTFVCPTELMAFQSEMKEFDARNTVVLGCSVDSQFTHAAWTNTSNDEGGIQGVEYPLLADVGGKIANKYGVLGGTFEEEGESYTPANVAYRGMFVIDKKGIVRAQVVTDEPVGRNVKEALRLVDALQFFEEHGDVCPANWEKGDAGMKKTKEGVAGVIKK
jgi:peroxiredoxin (alkyl hydroperoxide reductase subunit C)